MEIELGLLEKALQLLERAWGKHWDCWGLHWDCWEKLGERVGIAGKSVGKGLVLLEKAWRRR